MNLLEEFKPLRARMLKDKETQQSRGSFFVQLDSAQNKRSAIESFNGMDFGGRQLFVNEANFKTNKVY